jgi:hypothetical protein
MLNKYVPYGEIPFFWTRQYNKSLVFVGNSAGHKEVHIAGSLDKENFLAYYIDGEDKVVAVAGMAQNKAALTYLEAMKQNSMPSGSAIKSGAETWETVAGRLKQNVGGARCKRANCCQKKSVV